MYRSMDELAMAEAIQRADDWDEVRDIVEYLDSEYLHIEKDENGHFTGNWEKVIQDWADERTKVRDTEGRVFDITDARVWMDSDICEAIHGHADTEQDFFDEYCAAHLEKHGKPLSFPME